MSKKVKHQNTCVMKSLNLLSSFGILLIFPVFMSFSFFGGQNAQEPWPVPDKYKTLKNPVSADKSSVSVGSSLYSTHCKSCHGKEGLGDGSKAAQLDTSCGDFTSDDFKSQSDGSIFYKIKIGRKEMPGFEKKLPDDEDIWHIVNFVRTLE